MTVPDPKAPAVRYPKMPSTGSLPDPTQTEWVKTKRQSTDFRDILQPRRSPAPPAGIIRPPQG